MLAHVLVLHLLFARSPSAPTVHVLPPLELSRSLPALAQAEPAPWPEAASPVTYAAPAPRGRLTVVGYAGGLAGTLASDLVFGGMIALGFDNLSLFSNDSSGGWAALALAGAVGFLLVTPAATVWGAQKAEGFERPGLAYAVVFAVRLLGFLLAPAFPPILIVTELVAAPLAAAAIAASGRPIGWRAAPPPDFPEPEPEAEPRPDPAPGGSPISRQLCPDAAFALR